MAPVVIADSDDEDDFEDSPQQSPAKPRDAARIFDEQSEAARLRAEGLSKAVQEKGFDTSEGFQPSDNGFEPASLPSTDPLHGHEDGGRPWVSKWPEEDTDELWEIPSSPDESRIQRSRPKAREKRNSKPKSTHDHASSFLGQEYTPQDDENGGRSKKRRKLSLLQQSTQENDSVNLVPVPSMEEDERNLPGPAPSTMPPPTLPIDRSSFAVGRKHTASTPKKAYESTTLESSQQPSQDQGPSRPGPEGFITRSSGSATNVNTPRSDYPSSRGLNLHEGKYAAETSDKLDEDPLTGQWNSSPDEIAVVGTGIHIPQAGNRKSKECRQTSRADTQVTDELDANHSLDDLHHPLGANEEGDSDFVEKPSKRKKQRGRPKKNTAPSATLHATSTDTPHAADGRSVTKQKKKRGRPKKADLQATETAKSPQDNPADLEDGTRVASKTEEVATGKAEDGVEKKKHLDASQDQGETDDAGETRSASPLDASEKEYAGDIENKVGNKDVTTTFTNKKTTAGLSTAGSKTEEKPGVKQGKQAVASTISASGKPLYRVGLSKRSRIAPLLKSVRK